MCIHTSIHHTYNTYMHASIHRTYNTIHNFRMTFTLHYSRLHYITLHCITLHTFLNTYMFLPLGRTLYLAAEGVLKPSRQLKEKQAHASEIPADSPVGCLGLVRV